MFGVNCIRDFPHLYQDQIEKSSKLQTLYFLEWYPSFDVHTMLYIRMNPKNILMPALSKGFTQIVIITPEREGMGE